MGRFGELEAVIINRLWEWGRPATVQELLEDLRHETPATPVILLKALDALHRAGFLERGTVDGTHLYWPAISQAELKDLLMSYVLGTARNRIGYVLTCVRRVTPTGSFTT
ncbi:BlaI/MecI/CopY family transcriptional regulator [Nonomuraea basaltis]|uniref:BlaI/MecI/CopY family transcriptional regulator n=1 Tax=Nonomuraea basaltis TaxID=2495887 RepID=UPI00110C4F1D|nr:BlaI/MecI/CopY family transcriptional regulator [Nonomuraea basaltis]TMR95758.1 BlaI/MecI/CopY family transcriptional regulator [Nonomuraea basaltis]